MRFIITNIFINAFVKVLVLLTLYHISAKISINRFWRSEKLIIIHKTNIPLFNIKVLI